MLNMFLNFPPKHFASIPETGQIMKVVQLLSHFREHFLHVNMAKRNNNPQLPHSAGYIKLARCEQNQPESDIINSELRFRDPSPIRLGFVFLRDFPLLARRDPTRPALSFIPHQFDSAGDMVICRLYCGNRHWPMASIRRLLSQSRH